jgi:uncharacterized cupin superfamily protein
MVDDGPRTAAAVERIAPKGPPGVGLVEWEALDPANLVSGEPVQHGHVYDEDAALGYSVGVWRCTPFDDAPGPYPVDEYMLLLDGEVVMATPDGAETTIGAGEAFVIPKGLTCQWRMPVAVRKVFMILDRPDRAEAANLSLGRIVKPPMIALGATGEGAVATTHVAFVNADGRMVVERSDFSQPIFGPSPSDAHRLTTVLSGEMEVDGVLFGPGETAYLRAGACPVRRVAAGTALIEARFLPAP